MTGDLKLKIIYALIIILLIGIDYFFYKAVHTAFNRTPDDPSFTEKHSNHFVGILKKMAVSVLAVAVVVAGVFIIVKMEEASETDEQNIIAEYEALNEDNVDPENGKTILTQAFLMKEYKLYYANSHGWNNFESTIYKGLFLIFLFIAGGPSCIYYAIRFFRQKKKVNILSIVASVLLIPTVYFGFLMVDKLVTDNSPDPARARVTVSEVTITSRREDVYHDEESGDTSKYYITIDYGDGNGPVTRKVDYSFYYVAEDPGTYLMGQAVERGNRFDFKLYSMKEYEEEK